MAPSFSLGLGSKSFLNFFGKLKILEGSSVVAFQVGGWLEGGGRKTKKIKHFFERPFCEKQIFVFFLFVSTPPSSQPPTLERLLNYNR